MRILKGLLLITLLHLSNISYSQVYENIYEIASVDIQNKMNTNKINGIDILTDINASFQIGISGLLASERDSFLTLLNSDSRIETVNLAIDNMSISILCNASFSILDFNQMLSTTSGIVTGSAVNYLVIIN